MGRESFIEHDRSFFPVQRRAVHNPMESFIESRTRKEGRAFFCRQFLLFSTLPVDSLYALSRSPIFFVRNQNENEKRVRQLL